MAQATPRRRSVRSAVFAPDDSRILTASDDGTARLGNGDGQPLATLQGHQCPVESAVFASNATGLRPLAMREDRWAEFAPDGSRILTVSADNTARLWDGDGKPLATLEGHQRPVRSTVFAPDGKRILTAS